MTLEDRLLALGISGDALDDLTSAISARGVARINMIPKLERKQRRRVHKLVRRWLREVMGNLDQDVLAEFHCQSRQLKRQKVSRQTTDKITPPQGQKSFYRTAEWKQLRYDALKRTGGRCELCGFGAKDGARMNVDHILPISKFPKLKREPTNLQVLCASCNWGKGNRDTTDWRLKAEA